VSVGSLLPGSSLPMRALSQLDLNDKFEHAVAYAVLAWIPAVHERRKVVVVAAISAVAMGVGLEYLQLYSGWRDFEVGDIIADAGGVSCGIAAALPFRSAALFRSVSEHDR
jgi:VanZ family protein